MSKDQYQKPFLKWAGGKYKLLNILLPEISTGGGRFIEPFVGSGVVFLNLFEEYANIVVGDSNPDLINLYSILKADASIFIPELKAEYFDGASHNEQAYYAHRLKFNSETDVRERAKLFVYLNRHCFNGLCRYNSKGEFNVPFGKYKTIYFPEEELYEFQVRARNVEFKKSDFVDLTDIAVSGDTVYMDPPYVPLTTTSNFSDYSSDGGFNHAKQKELAATAEKLKQRGVRVVISNHDTDESRNLYCNADRIISIKAPRRISSNGSRAEAPELLAIYE